MQKGRDYMYEKNSFVEVHSIVFDANERTAKIPDDTLKVPYEMFVKGYLVDKAEVGDDVEIITVTGRSVRGKLLKVNPTFKLDYGKYVPELSMIKRILDDEIE